MRIVLSVAHLLATGESSQICSESVRQVCVKLFSKLKHGQHCTQESTACLTINIPLKDSKAESISRVSRFDFGR